MKTLKEFLEKSDLKYCHRGLLNFAKDLTLEEFLNTCERGDWILWLFARMNPESLQELSLAKGHCDNTVRELMMDERSIKAVDVAIAFGEGKATREELDAARAAAAAVAAADAAHAAAARAASAAIYGDASAAIYGAAWAADADWSSVAAAYAAQAAYAAARIHNQKLTADICRQYLPLEIWNQKLI